MQRPGNNTGPVPNDLVETIAEFSERLGVPQPPIYRSGLQQTGAAICVESDCVIQLGSRFDNPFWASNPQAVRALLGHEMGHVAQVHHGREFSTYLIPVLYIAALALMVAAGTGIEWWAGTLIAATVIAGVSAAFGVMMLDDILFFTILIPLALSCIAAGAGKLIFLTSKKRDLAANRISHAAFRVAMCALCAMFLWLEIRQFETLPKQLELEADLIATCLVGPSAVKDMLGEMKSREGGNWHSDLYHPTSSERAAAIDAIDTPKKQHKACKTIL